MTQTSVLGGEVRPRGFTSHEDRAKLLGELHARPFEPLSSPRRIYHFAFATDKEEARRDRKSIEDICRARGVPPPDSSAKYHLVNLAQWRLRWEQHTEFTTYTWDTAINADRIFSATELETGPLEQIAFQPPGKLLVATHMSVVDARAGLVDLAEIFDEGSLCAFNVEGGRARVSSDFQLDPAGFTRILVEENRLGEWRLGVLCQRLLEIETYRTLALWGLPMAQQITPTIEDAERELAELTRAISKSESVETDRRLLDRLIDQAAEIEAQAARTAFRFGATRAYFNIVQARLRAIGEEQTPEHHRTFSAFFARRLAPAVATCEATEARQALLSQKLTRTADLLRTRVQFAVEEQNRDLLEQMNRRARMQLRLQQTVEGLSIAAVSYYVVGLIGYMAKGANVYGIPFHAELITAGAVPLVMLAIWLILRRVRASFAKADDKARLKAESGGRHPQAPQK